jgi:hypothetical protein
MLPAALEKIVPMYIDDKIIDPELLSMKFACDLSLCKGACCTFPGGSGAPLRPEEMEQIRKSYPVVEHYLPAEHRRVALKFGLWESENGNYTIRCYNNRACIFVMYTDDIAVCSLQHAHALGKIDFIKPQSCHLFPIRLRGRNRDRLVFEQFSECAPAYDEGKEKNISVVEFLQSAIVRVFGTDFYDHLADESRRSPQCDLR